MKISFIKTPKPRRFVHKPIYYDPAKEEREEREERVKKELGLNDKDKPFKTSIKRGSFRQQRYDAPEDAGNLQHDRKMANIRLIIVVIALILAGLVIYMTTVSNNTL